MFELEDEIDRYLSGLGSKQLISRQCRDEIESHLREEIHFRLQSGQSIEHAFGEAKQALGDPSTISCEFSKLFNDDRRKRMTNYLSHYFDRKVITKAMLGIMLGTIFMLTALMLEGGHITSILQMSSFLLVSSVAAVMSWIGASGRGVIRSYSDFLRGSAVKLENFRMVGRNFLIAGSVGGFIGIIHVVANLHQPDEMGPGVAIAIVSILYGFFGYLFFGLALEAWSVGSIPSPGWEFRWTQILQIALFPLLLLLPIYVGLGSRGVLHLINIPGVLIVSAGVLTILAFVRRFRRVHYSYMANGALTAGMIGCLFNYIHVMENLDKPDQIFIGLSVALLPLLYGVVMWIALRAMSGASASIQTESGTEIAVANSLAPYCIATISLLVISTALIVYTLKISVS